MARYRGRAPAANAVSVARRSAGGRSAGNRSSRQPPIGQGAGTYRRLVFQGSVADRGRNHAGENDPARPEQARRLRLDIRLQPKGGAKSVSAVAIGTSRRTGLGTEAATPDSADAGAPVGERTDADGAHACAFVGCWIGTRRTDGGSAYADATVGDRNDAARIEADSAVSGAARAACLPAAFDASTSAVSNAVRSSRAPGA